MKTFQQFQEGLGKAALIGTGAALAGLSYLKKKYDPVGNKRKQFQQKKKEKYEKLSGTEGQGYFD